MKPHRWVSATVALLMAVTANAACADINLDFVTVSNPGNANDTTGFGGVSYTFAIGKYEVTAGQYTAFLNAVAATDTYGLYNTFMYSDPWANAGCGIKRDGRPGTYVYSITSDRANRPVNYVSWGDAVRFTNWLHNGQPTGDQGMGTTENGAYYVNGAATDEELIGVMRNSNAQFWIPTENEWYKSAYHKNDGVTANYWDFPTGNDNAPSNLLVSPDPGNNANFRDNGQYSTGSPYWLTEVGEFENSDSAYGTFDQGGNVWEWNESQLGPQRGLRGGFWWGDTDNMLASNRYGITPTFEADTTGFRVASVPEPSSLVLVICGALTGLYWWKRRQ